MEHLPNTGGVLIAQYKGPRSGSDEPDFLCCVSVIFCVGPIFGHVDADTKAILLKRSVKNGDLNGIPKGR